MIQVKTGIHVAHSTVHPLPATHLLLIGMPFNIFLAPGHHRTQPYRSKANNRKILYKIILNYGHLKTLIINWIALRFDCYDSSVYRVPFALNLCYCMYLKSTCITSIVVYKYTATVRKRWKHVADDNRCTSSVTPMHLQMCSIATAQCDRKYMLHVSIQINWEFSAIYSGLCVLRSLNIYEL